ncbi:MAG: hypothetical protein ACREA9_21140 [Pyrinomonadaceae bacterium]
MSRVIIGYSACPLSRAAFEAHDHDVWTCDILPARDGHSKHLQGDIWDFLFDDWDFGVLHPMCTFLTTSGAWALMDPDFVKYPVHGYHLKPNPEKLYGAERRAAQSIELENFRQLLRLPFPVAIENPGTSAINTAIRKPDQVFHPYHFGDDASKGTGLWLTKGTPKLTIDPAQYVQPRWCLQESGKILPRWANQTDSGQNKLPPREGRWLERSETYPGVAAAMSQWAVWLNGLTP